MNYQHAFHAGNFADVHKHLVLTLVVMHLRKKDTAFRLIDTHAGAGRYDLLGAEALRSGEWRDGIGRLWDAARSGAVTEPVRELIAPYLDAVAALNPDGDLRFYPGSPLLAAVLLRPQDRLIACELEPRAAAGLRAALGGDRRAKVLALDGWIALAANVPPKERRGLVLIDPPFEDAGDFLRLSADLAKAYRKWPTGIYLLWYPIKERNAPDALAQRLGKLAIPKILRSELLLGPPRPDAGLVGSGLFVVNPPFTLAADLRRVGPELAKALAPLAHHRLDGGVPAR